GCGSVSPNELSILLDVCLRPYTPADCWLILAAIVAGGGRYRPRRRWTAVTNCGAPSPSSACSPRGLSPGGQPGLPDQSLRRDRVADQDRPEPDEVGHHQP